ncbi:hypothetical protein ABBQ32_005254 [Trebouxia sp. C0010 RCD-2024]
MPTPLMDHGSRAAASLLPSKAWLSLRPQGRRSRPRRFTHAISIVANAHNKPLVVVGSVNADLMLQVDRFPKPGETLSAKSMATSAGGKGANQAAAAASLGYPTYFLGQVGTDANAKMLRDSLQKCGVHLSYLREVEGPSGTAMIMVDPSGENIIMIVGGANQSSWNFSEEDRKLLRNAGAILLQREVPEEVNLEVAKLGSSAGVTVVLDCGGADADMNPELLKHLTIISPNESELANLTGMPTDGHDQVVAAARHVQEMGAGVVLAKLGTKGSMLIQKDEVLQQGVIKADKVVDTTGAGDCFTAAVAVAILEGKSYQEAMQFAAAASSLCVGKPGAMPSLPDRASVDSLQKQQQQQ